MASSKALVIQSGITKQIPDGDTLLTGVGLDRSTAGALTLAGATGTSVVVGPNVIDGGLAAPFNFGGAGNVTAWIFGDTAPVEADGGFDRETAGALSLGPTNATSVVVEPNVLDGGTAGAFSFGGAGNVTQWNFGDTAPVQADGGFDRETAGALSIGDVNATSGTMFGGAGMTSLVIGAGMGATDTIDIGGVGSLTTIKGDLQVDGAETVVGTSTFTDDAQFNGNVIFGNAATDTVLFTSHIITNGLPLNAGADPAFGAAFGSIYTKDIGAGVIEAFYIDEAGNVEQLSGAGGANTLAAVLAAGNFTGGNDIDFTGGDNIVALGDGVAFTISYSGAATAGGGGSMQLTAQSGGAGGAGGSIELVAGAGDGASAGGTGQLSGGSGGATGAGGTALVLGGSGGITSGAGGAAFVSGGTGTAAGSAGGAATLSGGAGVTTGAGGDVVIDGGASPAGTKGSIDIGTNDASAVNIGNATDNPAIRIDGSGGISLLGDGTPFATSYSAAATAGAGGAISITSQTGFAGSLGGNVTVTAGAGGAGAAGGIGTFGGGAGGTNGAGGIGRVGGGNGGAAAGGSPAGAGGSGRVQGGLGGAGGAGAGETAGAGGPASVLASIGGASAGVGPGGAGGTANVFGGTGGAGSGTADGVGGGVVVLAGDAGTGGTGAAGGDVFVEAGAGSGAGADGSINIGTDVSGGTTSAILLGNATNNPSVTVQGTGLRVTNGTAAYVELDDGVTAAVSPAGEGRLRYNDTTGTFQVSISGGAYTDLAVGGAESLNATLAVGNTTGSSATTSGFDVVFSGDGVQQDAISIGGVSGLTFDVTYASAATANAAGIQITGQTGGGATGSGGSVNANGGAGAGSGVGGGINLTAGGGGATGNGGSALIRAGAGGATSGNAGSITLLAGAATDGDGGALSFTATSGVGTNRAGGSITGTAGAGTGTGAAGTVAFTAGAGDTGANGGGASLVGGAAVGIRIGGAAEVTGGATSGSASGGRANLTGGAGTTGTGGNANVNGGDALGAGGSGGLATVIGGDGTVTGGDVEVSGGIGGTTNGAVNLGVDTIGGSTSAVNIGNVTTNPPVTIQGSGGLSLTTDGFVRMDESAAAPTTGASEGAVYLKDAGGVPQLFFRTESNGTEYQITPPASSTTTNLYVTGLTIGGSVASGDAVYVDAASSVDQSDASAAATAKCFGFYEGVAGQVTIAGVVTPNFTAAPTAGDLVYLSLTAGEVTPTAPSGSGEVVTEVGIALTTTTMLIQVKKAIQL